MPYPDTPKWPKKIPGKNLALVPDSFSFPEAGGGLLGNRPLPGGPRERTITYTAPFDLCDREADYATAWAAFEQRRLK